MPIDKKIEAEANVFALLLLMPTQFIKEDLANGLDLGSDEDVKKIAKKYEVSVTAVAMRFALYFKNKLL